MGPVTRACLRDVALHYVHIIIVQIAPLGQCPHGPAVCLLLARQRVPAHAVRERVVCALVRVEKEAGLWLKFGQDLDVVFDDRRTVRRTPRDCHVVDSVVPHRRDGNPAIVNTPVKSDLRPDGARSSEDADDGEANSSHRRLLVGASNGR
jgi:hypothetical protein